MKTTEERPVTIHQTIDHLHCDLTGELLVTLGPQREILELRAECVAFRPKVYIQSAAGPRVILARETVELPIDSLADLVGPDRMHELFPELATFEEEEDGD